MSGAVSPSGGPERLDPTIAELREELRETQQGLLALTLELEDRVEVRTRELQARAARAALLAELSQLALAEQDAPLALSAIVEKVTRGMEASCGALLRAARSGRLVLTCQAGEVVEGPATEHLTLADCAPVRDVIRKGVAVSTPDILRDPRFSGCPLLRERGFRWGGVVSVPAPGAEAGALLVAGRSERVLDADELTFLETAGRLIASALARQRVEGELRERLEELARSNEDLQQFAYVASHDLQEPLRMVASFVQLLARRYEDELDDRGRQYIEFAVDGATRMQGLISDILLYSRVRTRGADLAPVVLDAVADRVLAQLGPALRNANGVVERGPLPSVMGDESQLAQLLTNLVSNAIKFAGDDGPRIELSAEPCARGWRLRVRDHGIGFSEEYAERIFLMFQRLHTRAEYPGSGIGLAICKRIVERHGGRMWAESTVGDGATFYIELQAVRAEDA